jgi:hypothetical protein
VSGRACAWCDFHIGVLELGRSWIEGTFHEQNELHEFGKEQEETVLS